MAEPTSHLVVDDVRLEHHWVRVTKAGTPAPTLVFLHEGLGCVSTWRDFPDRLALATGLDAFVFSRAGYGRSDPCALPRPVRFMHDEAETLTRVLALAGIQRSFLVGHSDGASIALLHAGGPAGEHVDGVILEAPHVFTEPEGLASIAAIGETWQSSGLREKLARHHGDNVDVAFRGWNDVWLDPEFESWNIEDVLPKVAAPVLIVQGEDDQYGTWRQVEAIERQVGGAAKSVPVPACGHSPHREQEQLTLAAMTAFIEKVLVEDRA
ncbi:MAG: alpha/beta hydrolase [Acidobacteriota bacterium]